MLSVCAYCRVSTDKSDQINSLENQKYYFANHIAKNPEWSLFKIYADEGITGTSTKNRTAFNQMISDAQSGNIDLIITKEVSRFARNTMDILKFTRMLKEINIAVIFINDNINTLDCDAELRLTIMSGIAQEESRKTSERIKWGQRRQMERGIVFGRDLLGFSVKNGVLSVNEKEAETVRRIFYSYLYEEKSANAIARELETDNIPTKRGNKKWIHTTIYKILQNEKYAGHLKQQKTYTQNYLTHKKSYNKGDRDFVVIENHHTAIIDPDIFNQVQTKILNRRKNNIS